MVIFAAAENSLCVTPTKLPDHRYDVAPPWNQPDTTMPEHRNPRVAIGMPVFNGEATVANAIASILTQTYADFRLIISDNASTDATSSICARFANNDPRVEYCRQGTNIGAEANFDFVLRRANAEYFMWAAADDIRSTDYLALCVGFLDEHPAYVAAGCQASYIDKGPDPVIMADRSLEDDDPYENVINVFDNNGRLRVNSRFYALVRRDALSFWLTEPKRFLGSDWVLTIKLLWHGKFKRVDAGYLALGWNGASKQLDVFASYRTHLAHWLIPFLELSREANGLLVSASRAQKFELWKRLFCLNLRIAKRQVSYEIRRWWQ